MERKCFTCNLFQAQGHGTSYEFPFLALHLRYEICAVCCGAAKNILTFTNKHQNNNSNSHKGLVNILEWVKEMKKMMEAEEERNKKLVKNMNDMEEDVNKKMKNMEEDQKRKLVKLKELLKMKESEEAQSKKLMKDIEEERDKKLVMEDELNKKITYLSGFATALKDQLHVDIHLKPGNNGPSIPAHRALLATKSCKFRNMMDTDECKAITIPELNHEELESLLDFLYTGSLPKEKLEKHVCSLMIAAEKYEISFLQKFCEHHMIESLNSANALDILEISDSCSNKNLKETVFNFIDRNVEAIVFSERFEAFIIKNPHLSLRITRAALKDTRKKAKTGV